MLIPIWAVTIVWIIVSFVLPLCVVWSHWYEISYKSWFDTFVALFISLIFAIFSYMSLIGVVHELTRISK